MVWLMVGVRDPHFMGWLIHFLDSPLEMNSHVALVASVASVPGLEVPGLVEGSMR